MRQQEDKRTRPRTSKEWAVIAEEAAGKAKQEFNRRSGSPQVQSPLAIMFLLCIALGLTALFLPQFFDRWFVQPSIEARRPQAAWFHAHPVAYIAAAIIVYAVWWGAGSG